MPSPASAIRNWRNWLRAHKKHRAILQPEALENHDLLIILILIAALILIIVAVH